MKTLRTATALALGTAFISGVNNFLTKSAVMAVGDPITFTFIKNTIVAVFFIGAVVLWRRWSEIQALNRTQLVRLGLIAVIGGSVPFALYFTGLTQTSAVNASLIHKTLVVWVFLFAWPFLRERMTWGMGAGIAAIFVANMISVGGFTGFRLNSGEFMIVLATVLWAVENVIAKKVLRDVSSLTVGSARMVLGSVFLLIILLMLGRPIVPQAMGLGNWALVGLTSVLLFGYVVTWYRALQLAPATYVAALLLPATLVTNMLSAVFVTHALDGRQAVSGALFLIGAGVLVWSARRMTHTFLENKKPRLAEAVE